MYHQTPYSTTSVSGLTRSTVCSFKLSRTTWKTSDLSFTRTSSVSNGMSTTPQPRKECFLGGIEEYRRCWSTSKESVLQDSTSAAASYTADSDPDKNCLYDRRRHAEAAARRMERITAAFVGRECRASATVGAEMSGPQSQPRLGRIHRCRPGNAARQVRESLSTPFGQIGAVTIEAGRTQLNKLSSLTKVMHRRLFGLSSVRSLGL